MKAAAFRYECPETVEEAIALLAAGKGNAVPVAGGQSLVPMMAFRLATPTVLVDLRRLPEMDQIDIDDRGTRLGAKVRWRDILADARLARAQPLLTAAVGHIAHYQIRNRGTVGGSLALAAFLSEEPDADENRIREVLSGNICRCTGYISIIEAVLEARAAYQDAAGRSRT